MRAWSGDLEDRDRDRLGARGGREGEEKGVLVSRRRGYLGRLRILLLCLWLWMRRR